MMIGDAALVILAATFGVTCGVGIVMSLHHWFDERASSRRCAERRVMAELEIATALALRMVPDKLVSDLTRKIVPLRPDSA